MRCNCLKCEYNEEYYCILPDGKVVIDENGVCDLLWVKGKAAEGGEQRDDDR